MHIKTSTPHRVLGSAAGVEHSSEGGAAGTEIIKSGGLAAASYNLRNPLLAQPNTSSDYLQAHSVLDKVSFSVSCSAQRKATCNFEHFDSNSPLDACKELKSAVQRMS